LPRRYPEPAKHGKHRRRRAGTHKRATSPETKAWESEHLIPARPSWLAPETYVKLADLRRQL